MADARFASLQGQKYINLETFRKNGQGVRTPVWFAGEPEQGVPEKLYVYSTADSGKAKRIRNNPRVRVAPCDVRGKLFGEWIPVEDFTIGARGHDGHFYGLKQRRLEADVIFYGKSISAHMASERQFYFRRRKHGAG